MAASIPHIYSALNFFVNANLICYCHSQIFDLCDIHNLMTSEQKYQKKKLKMQWFIMK